MNIETLMKVQFPEDLERFHPITFQILEIITQPWAEAFLYRDIDFAVAAIILVHLGKRDYPYQSCLRLSLRHGFSRNPEGFKPSLCLSDGNLYAARLTPRCTRAPHAIIYNIKV